MSRQHLSQVVACLTMWSIYPVTDTWNKSICPCTFILFVFPFLLPPTPNVLISNLPCLFGSILKQSPYFGPSSRGTMEITSIIAIVDLLLLLLLLLKKKFICDYIQIYQKSGFEYNCIIKAKM